MPGGNLVINQSVSQMNLQKQPVIVAYAYSATMDTDTRIEIMIEVS